jgi:putative SOS response-associated peptidase YedK
LPGRLFLTRPLAEIAAWAGVPGPLPEDPPRANIAPGQQVTVLTADGWARMRWGMIPVGRVNARGRPVMETIVNARSETVFDKTAYTGVGRGVVPVDGWYEWTGKVRRKTAWRIGRADGAPLGFAAITDSWTAPGGTEVAQVAMVTCAPSADVAKVHDRMGVILRPDQFPVWLAGTTADAAALMRPLAAGTLTVAEAAGVDWTGA